MTVAAGSGNTDFIISTKINLVNYPEVQTSHPIPSTGGSAHININISNIQKKRRQSQQPAAGSGNTKFVSTKMNLLNYPHVQTLHHIPSADGSAHVNSNVSNIQKKTRQAQEAGQAHIIVQCYRSALLQNKLTKTSSIYMNNVVN